MVKVKRLVPLVVALTLAASCGVLGDGDGGTEDAGQAATTSTTVTLESTSADDADGDEAGDGDDDGAATDAESTDQAATLPSATAGLVVLAPVPTMELTASGFKESVEDCDLVDIEVLERNARGDLSNLGPIAEGLLNQGVDLIATVATPSAQAAHDVVGARGGTTPVVYATVTDPFSAGLAVDPGTHEPWITGSASPPPIDAVIDAAQEIVPGLGVLGVVRNPEEANSRFTVESIQRVAAERGLTVETFDIAESSETGDAARALVQLSVDAFVIPTDTTVYAGMAAIADVGAENNLLVIGTDPNQANSGAAIALGSDYYGSGFRAGGIACRVLGGEATPADFDVVDIESLGITVNEAAAEAQGVVIPDTLRELAEFTE